MDKYTLLISNDERSIKSAGKNLLLGTWCLNDLMKQSSNLHVADPYGLSIKSKVKDFEKVRLYEKKILALVSKVLNEVHHLNFSSNIWKMIIGHWLRAYIKVIVNRYSVISQVLKNYEVNEISLVSYNRSTVIPKTTLSGYLNFDNSILDNFIYENIISLNDFDYIKKNIITDKSSREEIQKKFFHYPKRRDAFNILRVVNNIFSKLYRNNDIFIITSFLTYKNEVLLNLLLGNFPKLWMRHDIDLPGNINLKLRSELEKKINSKNIDTEENIILKLIFKLLPTCYLEDFDYLYDYTKNIKWPNKPKCIYTCNNFQFDEVFKLWSAVKKNEGSKYIVGQHGNNYGTHRYESPFIEEETATEFITWGWSNENKKYKKGFIFKNVDFKRIENPKDIIFQQICYLPRIQTHDEFYEYHHHKKEVFNIVKNIDNSLQENIIIRLHPFSEIYKKDDRIEWKLINKNLRIDKGYTNLSNLYFNARIIVHCYDSTGILETLSANIPTFAYFQNGLDHLNVEAKKSYSKLVDAQIIHFSSTSLAKKISEVYQGIEDWWNETERQEIIRVFVKKYANKERGDISQLVNLLNQ